MHLALGAFFDNFLKTKNPTLIPIIFIVFTANYKLFFYSIGRFFALILTVIFKELEFDFLCWAPLKTMSFFEYFSSPYFTAKIKTQFFYFPF